MLFFQTALGGAQARRESRLSYVPMTRALAVSSYLAPAHHTLLVEFVHAWNRLPCFTGEGLSRAIDTAEAHRALVVRNVSIVAHSTR